MRRRRRHPLDMLPLLDVFMVVLFVFASIQEDELQTSQAALQRASAGAERGQQALAATQARAQRTAEVAAERSGRLTTRAERAELETVRLREAVEDLRGKATRAVGAAPDVDEALRRAEVLAKLLDHFSVFEIEIAGDVDDVGGVVNRCCFRAELDPDGWQSCGVVPPHRDALAAWVDDGAHGLVAALRRTKGGSAITVLRQDEMATYRVVGSVEAALRERFPEHKLYNEGLALTARVCSSP